MIRSSDYNDWVWFNYRHSDPKRMDIFSNSEKELKVTYKNENNKSFSVILRPKKYPIGFHAKY
jgi:hypothetical protein